MLHLVLMVFAFVLFVVAAIWQPAPPRVHLGWLGLACWALATFWK